jgi:hypothetical protein
MANIPLYVPVTMTEKRAYTVQVYLCDNSAALDTAHLYVYALPVFTKNYNVLGFKTPYSSSPSDLWFSTGDLLQTAVSTRAYTSTGEAGSYASGTYRVFDRVSQGYNSGLPWTYANGTLTVTFNQAAAYPATAPNVDEFDSTCVPTRYVWSVLLSYEDGTTVRIVDGSPVSISVAGTPDSKPPKTELSICSAKVI